MKRMCNIFERKIAVECAKKRCGRKKALFGEEAQTPEAALTTSRLCVFSSQPPLLENAVLIYSPLLENFNIQGDPKKMHDSVLRLKSVPEVRFYFPACVLDSEFRA